MEGPCPDKVRFVELSRVYHTLLRIAKGRIPPSWGYPAFACPGSRPVLSTKTKRPDSNESGGIFLGRHSYALGTLTESDGWRLYRLRLLIFPQPLGRALKNQNAAPTTPPCFSRWLRSSSLHWADCLLCFAEPPCSSPVPSTPKRQSSR